MTEDIGKVFLSHHSSTVQLAEHLAKYLLRKGSDTIWDLINGKI